MANKPLTCGTCPIATLRDAPGRNRFCPISERDKLALMTCDIRFDIYMERVVAGHIVQLEATILKEKKILEFVITRRILAEMETQDA